MPHRPEPTQPVSEVRWSGSDVQVLLSDSEGARESAGSAAAEQDTEPGSVTGPAAGGLDRTLSERLGVENSIRMDKKAVEDRKKA